MPKFAYQRHIWRKEIFLQSWWAPQVFRGEKNLERLNSSKRKVLSMPVQLFSWGGKFAGGWRRSCHRDRHELGKCGSIQFVVEPQPNHKSNQEACLQTKPIHAVCGTENCKLRSNSLLCSCFHTVFCSPSKLPRGNTFVSKMLLYDLIWC